MTVDTPGPGGLRREYRPPGPLLEVDLAADWWTQFGRWFAEAVAAALPEPNAMVLASVDAEGAPNSRTVLLKEYDPTGFVFYTNYHSAKGREIAGDARVSLLFPWIPLHRQVIVRGVAERVGPARSAGYFRTRPRGAQAGAWASPQSSTISGREDLVAAHTAALRRFDDTEEIPVPPHWGGYLVRPRSVEFWQGQPDRLHDRLRFDREGPGWTVRRLAP